MKDTTTYPTFRSSIGSIEYQLSSKNEDEYILNRFRHNCYQSVSTYFFKNQKRMKKLKSIPFSDLMKHILPSNTASTRRFVFYELIDKESVLYRFFEEKGYHVVRHSSPDSFKVTHSLDYGVQHKPVEPVQELVVKEPVVVQEVPLVQEPVKRVSHPIRRVPPVVQETPEPVVVQEPVKRVSPPIRRIEKTLVQETPTESVVVQEVTPVVQEQVVQEQVVQEVTPVVQEQVVKEVSDVSEVVLLWNLLKPAIETLDNILLNPDSSDHYIHTKLKEMGLEVFRNETNSSSYTIARM